MSRRRYINPNIRRAVGERDSFTCQHCKTQEKLTIDHVIPVSRGGSNELGNLQILCRSCNARKGNGANAVPDPEAITAMVERLTEAVEAEAEAKCRFHDAIRRSRRNGKTLRHIASIVGLSVETVRKITMTAVIVLAAALLCSTASATTMSATATSILQHVAHRNVTAVCTPTAHEMSFTEATAADRPGNRALINRLSCKLIARMIRERGEWQADYNEQVALVAVIHEGMHMRGGPDWRDETSAQCRALHELPRVARWLGVQLQAGMAEWIWRHASAEYRSGPCSGFTS